MKYDLGIGVPYYPENRICKVCMDYLRTILELEIKDNVKIFIFENHIGLSNAKNVILDELLKECKYITFIDSDDRIAVDYIDKILEAIKTNKPIYQTKFSIIDDLHIDTTLKNRNTGVIYRNDIIKDLRFNSSRNFGEDKEFNDNLREYEVELVDTIYYYNYGINENCITYKYSRGEIKEFN